MGMSRYGFVGYFWGWYYCFIDDDHDDNNDDDDGRSESLMSTCMGIFVMCMVTRRTLSDSFARNST